MSASRYRWPSETKTPYPNPLWRHQPAPEQDIAVAPLFPTQEGLPSDGPERNGQNPAALSVDAALSGGYCNEAPNPDNYQSPSGPMSNADMRAQGLG